MADASVTAGDVRMGICLDGRVVGRITLVGDWGNSPLLRDQLDPAMPDAFNYERALFHLHCVIAALASVVVVAVVTCLIGLWLRPAGRVKVSGSSEVGRGR
jgi:hypothetical protein